MGSEIARFHHKSGIRIENILQCVCGVGLKRLAMKGPDDKSFGGETKELEWYTTLD